jgi:hypothetical protein
VEAPSGASAGRTRHGQLLLAARRPQAVPGGLPYGGFVSQLDEQKLYYVDRHERYTLLSLELRADARELALAAGRPVTDVDFSPRSLWDVHFVAARGELWLHADEKNDERMNCR